MSFKWRICLCAACDFGRNTGVKKRRSSPNRHNAPHELPFTDIANQIPVRVMGVLFFLTCANFKDANRVRQQHRRDDDDDEDHPLDPLRGTSGRNSLFDKTAKRLGVYRIRSAPLLNVSGDRDDRIQPLASRYGIGYTGGVSQQSDSWRENIVFLLALCAGSEAMDKIEKHVAPECAKFPATASAAKRRHSRFLGILPGCKRSGGSAC